MTPTRQHLLTTLLSTATALLAATSCAASPLPGRTPLRDRAAGYEMTVLVEGVPARTIEHDGTTYLLGQLGARYTLRIDNHSDRRVEAVVSVDGRDVIDGRPADFRGKRGYLIPAWASVDIDGWRISQSEAAAFRFSSVPDSYAAQTGSAREVGVIGVAVFPERMLPPAPPRPLPYAVPHKQSFSEDRLEGSGAPEAPRSAPSASAAAPSAAEMDRSKKRSGLGTEYGEAVSSPITEVEFVRASAARPSAVLGVRYNDRDGLRAMGVPVDEDRCASESDLRLSADPFPVNALTELGFAQRSRRGRSEEPSQGSSVVDRRYAPPPAGWRRACSWR